MISFQKFQELCVPRQGILSWLFRQGLYFKGFKYKPINGYFLKIVLKNCALFLLKKSPKIGIKTKRPLEFSNESKATPCP